MNYIYLLILFIACFLRAYFMRTSVSTYLESSNEFSTTFSSWNGVTEGLALYRAGINPYSGDAVHISPLLLRGLHYVTKRFPHYQNWLFIIADLMIAYFLSKCAKHFGRYCLAMQSKQASKFHTDAVDLLLKKEDLVTISGFIYWIYLFNPFAIACCASRSLTIFTNLSLVLTLFAMLSGRKHLAIFMVAWAAHLSLYPAILIVPIAMYFVPQSASDNVRQYLTHMATSIALFCLIFLALLFCCFAIEESWQFATETYGFLLRVGDLTPNVGLFWYYFTEVFDHFNAFFVCVFQLICFFYLLPLCLRFQNDPVFIFTVMLGLISIFKSYPDYGDGLLFLSVATMWQFLFKYLRNVLFVVGLFIASVVLAPIMYHLWIYRGSANANFYFAISLTYCSAQIFFLTDLMFAYIRREYFLFNGQSLNLPTGKQGVLQLN